MKAKKELIPFLKAMLAELRTYTLVVKSHRSNDPACAADGGKIRVAEKRNVLWYRELCKMHPKPLYRLDSVTGKLMKRRFKKNPESNLNKERVMIPLKTLIIGKHSYSKHVPYLLDIARQKMKEYSRPHDEVDWKFEMYS